MFFGKRRGKKKRAEEERAPAPEELDGDFGYDPDHLGADDSLAPGSKPPARPSRPAEPEPPAEGESDPGVDFLDESRPTRRAGSKRPGADATPARDPFESTMVDRPPAASSPSPLLAPTPPASDEGGNDVTVFLRAPVSPTAADVAWLVAANGADRGTDYRLGETGIRVGTGPECELRLGADDSVSRRHAEIAIEAGEFVLRDLGSTNGTFHNGRRTDEARLADDDRVKFGLSEFVFKVVRL